MLLELIRYTHLFNFCNGANTQNISSRKSKIGKSSGDSDLPIKSSGNFSQVQQSMNSAPADDLRDEILDISNEFNDIASLSDNESGHLDSQCDSVIVSIGDDQGNSADHKDNSSNTRIKDNSSDNKSKALDYYNNIKNQKKHSMLEKEQEIRQDKEWATQASQEAFLSSDIIKGDKRAATWKILKNKGLTPKRKKENRNPRVKRRQKYETAVKRLKDYRRVAVDKSKVGSYKGETSGIKGNLSRSVKL